IPDYPGRDRFRGFQLNTRDIAPPRPTPDSTSSRTSISASIFIDTADAYSDDESEVIVGKALKGRRDEAVLATKAAVPMGEDPNMRGGSRRWITRAVEGSLRRLQTDHIDLYQIHRPSPDTDVEETLSLLTDLMRAGKIRAFGASTVPASDIIQAQWTAERRGLARLRTEQPPYSILNHSIEREVLPACQRYGMGVLAWSPLAKGMLTGKYRRGAPQPDTLRAKFFPKAMSDEGSLNAVEELIPLAEDVGIPLMHMALAFVVAHPALSAAIIGPRTMEQLDGPLADAEVVLGDDVLDRIDEIVPFDGLKEPRRLTQESSISRLLKKAWRSTVLRMMPENRSVNAQKFAYFGAFLGNTRRISSVILAENTFSAAC
ncbi:aldo/keto reductase, partial [Pseudogemmobacter sonorensis]|uniref:aldo/keto reductase n=1 Tax=Pseudogemmobacter sonorensis TaxID=2989681 RepID=UPI0036CE6C0E